MDLFIDTANLDEIKEIAGWGVIRGVTTNPKIFSSEEGVDLKTRVMEILKVLPGPLSVEVTTNDFEEMVSEAMLYASWSSHIVVKVPMNAGGLRAAKVLGEKNIKTNVTAIMSVNQALLAACVGATYASIFLARIGDIGSDYSEVIRQTRSLYDRAGYKTKIIVGSIRHLQHINQAAEAGTHITTVPYKFFREMAHHPQTDKTINEFLEAWNKIKQPV
ncbi:MAG: fructose-6-phosphate aldolase [Candidatus Omnitrophica bacterium]|nr:fructose-6-phosphate aldolase [Candidatus Omnitrophota bacterium]